MANRLPIVFVASDYPMEGSVELDNGDSIHIGTTDWYNWLKDQDSFRFESGLAGKDSFTARKRKRDSGDFWYAYRKQQGKLISVYMGKSEALTVPKLLEVAAKLQEPSQPKLHNKGCTQPGTTKKQLNKSSYTQPGITEAIEALWLEFSAKLTEMEARLERVESSGKQLP